MWGALMRLLRGGPDPRIEASLEAERILQQARDRADREAGERLQQAQEQARTERDEILADVRGARDDLQRAVDRLDRRESSLDDRARSLEERDDKLNQDRQRLENRNAQLDEREAEHDRRLEEISSFTRDEARTVLFEQVEQEISDEAGRMVREAEQKAKDDADARARKIVATAIQRVASEVTTESTVSIVQIPSDEMKGRIIGREGRNIRALESALGCDLIIDDTPDVVTVSGFDPVRREIGRLSLSRLVADGRIHPTRIEETVAKAQRDVERIIRESGDEAAIEAHCSGLPREMLDIFGRLRFRTSYGQNQLRHAVETAHIGAMIAQELHADVEVTRRGSLLHDVGKAIDHEVEGTHAIIGGDLARRFKMSEEIAHCIEAHHDEVELRTVEAIIVQMADAISGGRPGARRESVERYIERLRAMEDIATSFEGVGQAYAIQAGREVRVVVDPREVDDLGAMRLARDISKQIEESLQYPGQIRVTVLRETRAAEYAR
ncbi:MAG: ribonuclease Y [Chloroflexi bacterium]|nr:ribonuclease Y [Chloroflexota bacterium]MYF80207.1 ribonuclease Y [Chloroflexota bacterium]MYI03740.1 ribonuclease Y [Chloroflexota bacterium]